MLFRKITSFYLIFKQDKMLELLETYISDCLQIHH